MPRWALGVLLLPLALMRLWHDKYLSGLFRVDCVKTFITEILITVTKFSWGWNVHLNCSRARMTRWFRHWLKIGWVHRNLIFSDPQTYRKFEPWFLLALESFQLYWLASKQFSASLPNTISSPMMNQKQPARVNPKSGVGNNGFAYAQPMSLRDLEQLKSELWKDPVRAKSSELTNKTAFFQHSGLSEALIATIATSVPVLVGEKWNRTKVIYDNLFW